MRFQNPQALWLLICLIPYAWMMISRFRKEQRELSRFFSASMLPTVVRQRKTMWKTLQVVCILAGLAMAMIGLAAPFSDTQRVEIPAPVVDIAIALDMSHSMNARDIAPSRFEAARRAILEFIQQAPFRVSLFVFSGETMLLAPFTRDMDALALLLSDLSPGQVQPSGTDMERLFVKVNEEFARFDQIQREVLESPFSMPKTLLVFTDGDPTDLPSGYTLQQMKALDIELWIVLVASENGSRVPIVDERGVVSGDYLMWQGQPYFSRPDIQGMQSIVESVSGAVIPYHSIHSLSPLFFEHTDRMKESHAYHRVIEIPFSLTSLFLALSVLLLCLGWIL